MDRLGPDGHIQATVPEAKGRRQCRCRDEWLAAVGTPPTDGAPRRSSSGWRGQATMSAMPTLLRPIGLDRHQKVRAWVDLPGVPVGTPGKVLQVGGLSWIRYRVLFENGVDHGLLDGRHIVAVKDFVPVDERVELEETVAIDDDGDADATTAGGDKAADNEFGVPAHLLERAQAARARRAAL